MRDTVSLRIGGQDISHFLGYSIEADLYQAADAFHLDLVNPEIRVIHGSRCELFVNNELELTGIIDKVIPGYDKKGAKLTIEGRDLMGLVVDAYCEEFKTHKNITLKSLAEKLLKPIPFISRESIVYQQGADEPLKMVQVEPGQTVFQVLHDAAASRGLMFYSLTDGTFCFGKPAARGSHEYTIFTRKDGRGNNVKDATRYQDISGRYSKITVLGQQQGREEFGMDSRKVNTRASVTDPNFPYHKPFVTRNNNDDLSPALQARLLLEKQRFESDQLFYKVPRHASGGRNWRINKLCRVTDEVFGIDGTYLIYNRVLAMDKQEGVITWLKLGPPGVVA